MNSRSFLVLTICLFLLAIAMALYVWQLPIRTQSESTLPAAARTMTPSATGSPRQATLWVAHDNLGVLSVQAVSIELPTERQRKAAEILRSLITLYARKDAPHHLTAAADVRSVYFVDPGLAVVDLNSELAEGQPSGVLPEELTIVSLAQTLSANFPEISRVQFLINGKEAETLAGHFDLSRPYSVAAMSDLVLQLSSR